MEEWYRQVRHNISPTISVLVTRRVDILDLRVIDVTHAHARTLKYADCTRGNEEYDFNVKFQYRSGGEYSRGEIELAIDRKIASYKNTAEFQARGVTRRV